MNEKSKIPSLHYQHFSCDELNESLHEEMYQLMQANYQDVNRKQFHFDLSKKQYAGLLFDDNRILRGFTTYALNPNQSGTEEYSILFSGDTIISPEYWGTIELIRGWCLSVASIIKTNPAKNWYWFLLSKGHRTFMYLPLFFKEYYPCIDADKKSQEELFKLLEEMATHIYPELYKKGSGIIQFPLDGGELKSELAQATFDKASKQQVRWFLEKNPGFYKGDELICLCKIEPENMRGFAKEFLMKNLGHNE